jgi:hypothetical protein
MLKLRTRTVAVAVLLTAFCLTSILEARVVSYAPYTDRVSVPAFHKRTTKHFVLIESMAGAQPNILISPPVMIAQPDQQLVLYDVAGAEEPRVIYPAGGGEAAIGWAAMRENAQGVPTILVYTAGDTKTNPSRAPFYALSTDGGATWKRVSMPESARTNNYLFYTDVGGPFTKGRYSPVRLGTAQFPFVVQTENNGGVFKIGADGSAVLLHPALSNVQNTLLGSDAEGTKFLIRSSRGNAVVVDINGAARDIGAIDDQAWYEGWIAPNDNVYLERARPDGRFLYRYIGTAATLIQGTPGVNEPAFNAPPQSSTNAVFFAVPTSDFNGAWMIQRGIGRPTTLLRFKPDTALQTMWNDVSGPEVEALHAGASGETLLVQVHRPRAQVQPLRIDPALAVWRVGEPAPSAYDELFLNEGTTKGFLHVDVDRMNAGDPWVFDSGMVALAPQVIISPAPAGGGSDVIQEWGVVRGSLKQQLVLPGIGRTPGAYGSNWATDVILYNPDSAQQKVVLQFVANGSPRQIAAGNTTVTVTLEPREIRLVTDALRNLFGLDNGTGSLFLTPDRGINATSRTYTRGEKGTYGFGMNAIDVYAAASPRFPVSFAGAFPGLNFRTNLIVTDTSGRGSNTALAARGGSGVMGLSDVTYHAPAWGQMQINNVNSQLGLLPTDNGGLLVSPKNGWVVASVFAVDNRTNDPTYFPPDVPSSVARTIAVIGHVDGANDSRFRTDLYLFNPTDKTRFVTLNAMPWNPAEGMASIPMTLLPNEARVVRDAYMTLFGKTGVAKLTYQSDLNGGIRVTSRTYSIDDNGGTFGFLTPPLNAFQAAATGEALEILGVTGGKDYRTNLGLVDIQQWPNGQQPSAARIDIIDHTGKTIDSFTTNIPNAGGMQINDLFRGRNLGDGPPAALIRVSPIRGLIAAYATVTDNGTNDSIYLAPNLAASPSP